MPLPLKEALQVEKVVAHVSLNRFIREPKHRFGAIGMYVASVMGPERAHGGRVGYNLVRLIDDMLDGDTATPDNQSPREFVVDIRRQIETGNFSLDSNLSLLAKYDLDFLDARKHPGDNVRRLLMNAIDPLIYDYDRAHAPARKLMTTSELEAYYRSSFSPIADIMLITLDSDLRSSDIDDFVMSQPRAFTVRDFHLDVRRGLINVPSEVLTTAELTEHATADVMWQDPFVRVWMVNELELARDGALRMMNKIAHSHEPRITKSFIKNPMKTVLKISEQYL